MHSHAWTVPGDVIRLRRVDGRKKLVKCICMFEAVYSIVH